MLGLRLVRVMARSKVVSDWLGVKGHAGTLLLEGILGFEGFSYKSRNAAATTSSLEIKHRVKF